MLEGKCTKNNRKTTIFNDFGRICSKNNRKTTIFNDFQRFCSKNIEKTTIFNDLGTPMYEKPMKNNDFWGGARRPPATPGDTRRHPAAPGGTRPNDENKGLRRRGSRARREEGDRRREERRETRWPRGPSSCTKWTNLNIKRKRDSLKLHGGN